MLRKVLIYISLVLLIFGCGLAYKVILGVDNTPSWKSDREIVKQAKKHKIPSEFNLVLDTSLYFDGLKNIYASLLKELNFIEGDSSEYFKLKTARKDDSQPVQFRLINKNGSEIFKIVNCYIDPPIPMNWNINGCFNSFPPKIEIQSLNSHNIDLNFILSNSTRIDNRKITIEELPQADYYAVVFWNDFYARPSRKLIKTVRKYIKDQSQSIQLIYINNQNAYLWQIMDSENKEKIKGSPRL
jgi:hypothetical protein